MKSWGPVFYQLGKTPQHDSYENGKQREQLFPQLQKELEPTSEVV